MNKAKQGGFAGGRRPLGYKQTRVDNRPDIAIDQAETDTVMLIKKLAETGFVHERYCRPVE